MTKNKKILILFSIILIILNLAVGCTNGGSSASTTPSGPGGGLDSTTVVPGIGTGGSIYILGTLDGEWTTGCEGGADGDNWSYIRTMTVSGNFVTQNENWYRQNQTCTGAADVSVVSVYTAMWGNYDTTGYSSDASYSAYSLIVTPLTANGLARLGNIGSCTSMSFTLNVGSECRNSTTGTFKYYLADNIYLPEVIGPEDSSSIGIAYAFYTFRKVVSNNSSIDGIYALFQGVNLIKIIISGDRYAYIVGRESFYQDIFIVTGSLLAGPAVTQPTGASTFLTTIKSKVMQPRSVSGALELNNASYCGHTDYSNGTVKNLLTSGLCTSSADSYFLYKLTGNALQFAMSNLPLPTVFPSGPVLESPWKY